MNKKERIEKCATKLFLEKGVENTSIREITEEANVAKGTFYLYYEDKKSLVSYLLSSQLNDIINQAMDKALKDDKSWISVFFNAIIDICLTETKLLNAIEKNLGSCEIKESIARTEDELIQKNGIIEKLVSEGYERQDAIIRMVLALRFTLVTCYGSIILNSPAPIDCMRSYILQTVCQMFNGGESSGNI